MKKRNHFILMLVFAIILSLFIAGCGSGGSSIKIATGENSGVYFSLGQKLIQIFEDNGISASALDTSGTIENLRRLKESEVELAFAQSDMADYAFKGIEMFEEVGATPHIQAIASLYDETVYVVALESRSIQSVDDLRGKRVSVGAPESGTEANARQILEMANLTFEDLGSVEHLDLEETTRLLKDGAIDAAFITVGKLTTALRELAENGTVRLVGFNDDHIARLIEKYPYYAEKNVSAELWPRLDSELKTVAVKTLLVAHADLDEELARRLTKTLFDHLEQFTAGEEPLGEQISLERALDGISIDIHPGAARFFEEMGVK